MIPSNIKFAIIVPYKFTSQYESNQLQSMLWNALNNEITF